MQYMCYIPLYTLLNGEKPSAGVMLPGHDIELTIPYQIFGDAMEYTRVCKAGNGTHTDCILAISGEKDNRA